METETGDKVTFRRATVADREEVIGLDPDNLIFDGMDYLPALYTTLLQDKHFWGYVAFVNGEMANFAGFYIDEEEKFFASISGRTKTKFLGMALSLRIQFLAYEEMKRKYSADFDCFYVAADKPKIYNSDFWSNPLHKLIRRHAFLTYIVPSRSVNRAAVIGATDPRVYSITVKHLDKDKSFQLLNSQQMQKYILKDMLIMAFNSTLPTTRHPKHLRRLITQSVVYVSYKSDGKMPSGVSYSAPNPAACGVVSTIFIYVFDHVDIALAHLTKHLAHTASVVNDEVHVGLQIYFPTDIDKEIVKEFLLPHFGQTKINNVHPVEYLFTAVIPKPFSYANL